jgi:hypothetical protein
VTTRSWILKLFTSGSPRSRTTTKRPRPRARLLLEALEDRLAPATFTVTLTSDTGGSSGANQGDLRYCLLNSGAGDTIQFAVQGTITLSGSELPPITHDLTITGPGAGLLSISGNNGSRVIEIDAGQSSFPA